MNAPMNVQPGSGAGDDLSALAWVHGELRRSLENAHKALRRHLKEAEALGGSDVDAVDPAVLRGARVQLHQGVGALELVGLPAPARLLRASESAVQRLAARPKLLDADAVETIERASFALLDYLARLLAGKPVSPVALFPQYRAAQTLAGAERVHPADLWLHDWAWQELPADPRAEPRAADDASRTAMEALALALMRQPDPALIAQMSDLCAALGAGLEGASGSGRRAATLWQLAAAFFEAQARGLLASDVYTKRIASRLLAQLRQQVKGEDELSERLAQDLLFFCAHARAPADASAAPRLDAVRQAWQIGGRDEAAAADYETPRLGRFDPAWIAQAKKRVAGAKDAWSAVAGGELHRLQGLAEQFALVGDSLQRLFPSGEVLAAALQAAVAQTVSGGSEPPVPLAMEVATAILYLDASIDDGELDLPGLGERVQRLASRIDDVRVGADAQPLEAWMEELYRRVSDRQTMGSVVQELRASLSEVEKQIDAYFRDPAQRQLLIPVPGQLSAMRGVLSVLGLDQASAAVLQLRDEVDALAQTEVDVQHAVQAGIFDRLADNLGALSFLIDMLSVQPQLAKSLFRYDAATGRLSAVMGQSERTSVFAELELEPAPAAPPAPVAAAVPAVPPVAPVPDSGLEDDAEMREIFIEEAREVVDAARASLARLIEQPEDLAEMTAVRRAFHTLKGSSRMVGLKEFGEAAWAGEQLFNARLAQSSRMDHALQAFTGEALDYLAGWVEAIAAGRSEGHAAPAVVRAADALRLDGVRVVLVRPHAAAPQAVAPAAPAAQEPALAFPEVTAPWPEPLAAAEAPAAAGPAEAAQALETSPAQLVDRVPDLPSAADLDFGQPTVPIALDTVPAAESVPEVSFELDLGGPADEAPVAVAMPEPPPVPEVAELPELDLAGFDFGLPEVVPEAPAADVPMADVQARIAEQETETETETERTAPVEPVPADAGLLAADDEQVKIIGPLRIGIPLFNIFLNEADELSRRLGTELAEWGLEHDHHPIAESTVALAHSLAGSSATVGYADLSALARSLEHALMRSQAVGRGRDGEPELFNDAAEEIRHLLHQFAAGFLREVPAELTERLADHERWPEDLPPPAAPAVEAVEVPLEAPAAPVEEEAIDVADAIDTELFPIFEDEADELLPQLQSRLRDWADRPADTGAAAACMRTLHTFKGGARLAGAMRLGEMAHRLETAIEALSLRDEVATADIDPLLARADAMASAFDALRKPRPAAAVPPAIVAPVVVPEPVVEVPAPVEPAPPAEPTAAAAAPATATVAIDWQRFGAGAGTTVPPAERAPTAGNAVVRVRGSLLDRMVNQAGEVSIARARIDADVHQLQGSLNELTDSLDRMRRQLRDIELQAETQIGSRMEAAKAAATAFDPLEMDRFTRFQELTRFLAESVNDVATLQRSLQRTLQSAEDELAAQARLTRELQDDLLRTRMVEFESMADRLHRTVRQAAKDAGRQVRLEIIGGGIEIDRGVLERMAGPFEHLLRNSVAHGIETPAERAAAGKDAAGSITLTITQEGNEVGVEVRDDGAGLDLARIRARAVERGLIGADAEPTEAELGELIYAPGFSTAHSVTELAGRGVGLDVVRAEVDAMGGRIQTTSTPGQGTAFRLLLPLTTAVTQIVMLRCGELNVAVPSTLVEVVRRARGDEIEQAYASGSYALGEQSLPFHWLGALLQGDARGSSAGRSQTVVVIRSAAQRVALHVDEVVGNQEVVVKNVGPQLARLPGLAGVTLLPSGAVALIYNPVALATLYGPAARARLRHAEPATPQPVAAAVVQAPLAPLVLVVDDSLTVRRVTQRLLVREGYRVVTAKDGLEAIERLADERPAVMLSDIEMPRMDGFDLLRNVRADSQLAGLPVIMISSRIAQKHRDYAAELGVDHFLGKPYAEDELLALVARYAGADIPT